MTSFRVVEPGGIDFSRWYTDERDRLVRSLLVIGGDAEAARDAVAEAFSRAYERWARVSAMASPTGWVYRVALRSAVGALPAREREVVVLRYVADLREREVAAALGISEGAASAALVAARRRLARVLGTTDEVTSDEKEASATQPKMRKSFSAWTFSFSSSR